MISRTLPRGSLLVTLPLVLVGTAYYFFLFAPGARGLERLRNELRATSRSIDDAQRLANEIVQTQKQRDEIQAYVERWRAQLPLPDRLALALTELSQTADRAGVTTTRFAPQAEVPLECLVQVPIEVEFNGPWSGCLAFVQELETSDRVIWIRKLDLSANGQSAQTLQGEIELVLFAGQSDFSG